MPKRSSADVDRPRHLHITLSEEEDMKLRILITRAGKGIAGYVRPVLLEHAEEMIDRLGLRPPALARVSHRPPLAAEQK